MRPLFVVMFASLVLGAAQARAAENYTEELLDAQGHRLNDPEYDLIRRLNADQERGIGLYRAGKFDQAYETLSEPARHGMKGAQHTLALMHLQGQSVEKNVLVGVALLGLAAESGESRLKREYKAALGQIPAKYKDLVKQQTAYYIERYGMEAQGVVCRREKRTDTNRKTLHCFKQPGDYTLYDWSP